MKIENLKPFPGKHCETTATGTLLLQAGINLSEPMLFGLGEGLGYIFWNMKSMSMPFIGGRIQPDAITANIAKNLDLTLSVKETSSAQKAWKQVKELLDKKQAVGLKLDCFYLEYFSRPFHFAGHYVAIYGYDDQYAYLIDTIQQGSVVKTSLKSLALARAEKGPMSSRNLFYYLEKKNANFNIEKAVISAIHNNCLDYLTPPIKNIGYKGIDKTSSEIIKWFKTSKNVENDFKTTSLMMERGGTGGALFRNLYRDFLKESYGLLKIPALQTAYQNFSEIAVMWNAVSNAFTKAAETKDIKYIEQASGILKTIAIKEKNTMELLSVL